MKTLRTSLVLTAFGALAASAPLLAQAESRVIEAGQPAVVIYPTVERALAHQAESATAASSNNLAYQGGTSGIGVETAPKVYLVLYGNQWASSDPSGEAALLESFLKGLGGSSWLNTVTQYCQGVAAGTQSCSGAGTPAGNQTGMYAGVWMDTSVAAPKHPTQSNLAAEAVKAAKHFGNKTAASNASVQYVIATPTGHNIRGFGLEFCAWHASTTSSIGDVAYTNLPYMTDAGSSCGANFNGLGANAGITIVEGHEFAETVTDQYPSSGWIDAGGSEIGDKCAWIQTGQGAAADTVLSTGTFPVQSLWSNAFGGGAGGCVQSF